MGLDSSSKAGGGNEQQQQRKKKATAAAAAAAASKREREREREADKVTVELRAVGFGKEVVLKQRRRMRRRRRLGEEERAAILLMALSGGVVYAPDFIPPRLLRSCCMIAGRILVSPSRGVVYDFIMLLPSAHLAGVRGFVINDHMVVCHSFVCAF